MKPILARTLVCLFLPTAAAGCLLFPGADPDDPDPGDPPECTVNEDCAHLDTDGDACTEAVCAGGSCEQSLLYTAPDCQCHTDADCDYFAKTCNTPICEDHQCVDQIAPAGSAPQQTAGDCAVRMCDGTSPEAAEQYDEQDIPAGDDCTIGFCDPTTGAEYESEPDGTACTGDGGAGFCFLGECQPCQPQDPTSCGDEGPDEPENDSGSTATAYTRYGHVCGFSDGTDVDWYTFYASDDFGSVDILDFDFWSTAPQLEVCAYVTCLQGDPGGGCSTKLPGPDGSQGCCWTGAPATLTPSWDLDCAGFEDRGTVYVSVRTPGGGACETYAMTANY